MSNYIMRIAQAFVLEQKLIDAEFELRAQEAKKSYWDACKLPRKQKKQVRKEAVLNYNLYKLILQW